MRVLWLINSSMMLQPTVESIKPYVDHLEIIFHDKDPKWFVHSLDAQTDLILFIGAGNGPAVTNPESLSELDDYVRLIHICTDGGCPGWWETLKAYKEAGIKTVNLDGSFETPKGLVDLVTLTPPNPKYYEKQIPWKNRPYPFGFMGGMGSPERQLIVNNLEDILTVGRNRNEEWNSYQQYADFMLQCRCILNFARTGMNGPQMHVKNRVLESAMAKACLFEQKGSPIDKWFKKGEHYLEWDNDLCFNFDDKQEQIAENLWTEVMEKHSPQKWFEKILTLI
jgi:hypothetical protein